MECFQNAAGVVVVLRGFRYEKGCCRASAFLNAAEILMQSRAIALLVLEDGLQKVVVGHQC